VKARATGELGSDRLVLTGAGVRFEASLTDGTFSVARGRSTTLQGVCARVELEDGRAISTAGRPWEVAERPRRFEETHGRGLQALLQSPVDGALRLRLELFAYDEQPFLLFRLGITNLGRTARSVRSLSPVAADGQAGGLTLAAKPNRWRWFRHGWQSWTPTLSLSAAQQDMDVRPPVEAPAPPPEGRGVLASEEVAALLDPQTGRTLVLGFVTARRQWTQVRLDAGRCAIEAVAFADGAPLRPGETIWSERLLVEVAGDAAEAFDRYAGALAREMGARVPAASPAGWCSWYYYFTQVTEEDVRKNLRFLQEHCEQLPVQYVQIDDGYQANIGDWTTTTEKFPRGMGPLAREIRDAGFVPGLWLAPLLAGETSRLFAQHPDWVIRDDDGKPALAMRNWNQQCYGLDCTNPQVERWLRDLFREVTEGWGYEYVKIDFLYGGALAGHRHDKHASRIEAYRRGLAAIRAGVGERFVLGCGALMGPSVGLIDAQRIGPDVAPWWRFRRERMQRGRGRPVIGGEPSTENALRNIFTRAWMHGRLWANDPDCLMAREDRTKLTLPEVQSLATAIALCGGALFISDDMARWSRRRLDLVSSLLPPLAEGGTARDLLRESMPSTMELEVRRPFESWRLVGRFNWSGRRRSLSVALPHGRWHAFEFWEGRYYGVHADGLVLSGVPAHGARLLALRRALGRPQLLGTTFHYSMGGREINSTRWDGRRRTLRIGLRPVAKQRGEVFVIAPGSYRFAEALLDGKPIARASRGGRVLSFRFALTEAATLTVRFA
jgi:alpha-galactosidase